MRKMCMYTIVAMIIGSLFIGSYGAAASSSSIEATFNENIYETYPGSQGFISLTIKNVGQDTIESIFISVDSDVYALQQSGDWSKSFGSLSAGSSCNAVFHYSVPSNADPGLYELEVLITTESDFHIRSASIEVVEQEVLDIVSVSPSYLEIGEQTTMTVNISNTGKSDISNIVMSWTDDYEYILPIGSDNHLKISSIEAESYVEVSFDVMVSPSLPAGVYPLNFYLNFSDKVGSRQTMKSQVGIQIGGGTNFEILVDDSSSGSATLSIANTGANTASSVIVSIPNQPGYAASGTSSVNLGNLEAGDYSLATFQITQTELSNATQLPNRANLDMSMENRPDFSNDSGFAGPGRPMGEESLLEGSDSGLPEGFMSVDSADALIVNVSYTDLFGNRKYVQKEVILSSTSGSSGTFPSMSGGSDFRVNPSSSQMSGTEDESFLGLDTGGTYILVGSLGIVLIICIIKFETIKKGLGSINAKRSKKQEDQ